MHLFFQLGPCSAKSIKLDSTFKQAVTNRGYANLRLKNYVNAKKDFLSGLKIDSNYITAKNGLDRVSKIMINKED